MSEPVAVPVACQCPTRHPDGDTVYLAPKMTVAMGIDAWAAVQSGQGTTHLNGDLTGIYFYRGITGWTFRDADGNPVRVDRDNLDEQFARYISWDDARTLAQKTDELYSGDIFRPLASAMEKLRESSRTGPTDGSTPASPASGPTPLRPSRRSSRNGTAGKQYVVPAR